MKKASIIISALLLIVSLPTFAATHFYQQLCNYTQRTLSLATSKVHGAHPRGLNGAKIAPNLCTTYRYPASPSPFHFDEYISTPQLSHSSLIVHLYILNRNNFGHKSTYIDIKSGPANGYLMKLSRNHRHYKIYICNAASANKCK